MRGSIVAVHPAPRSAAAPVQALPPFSALRTPRCSLGPTCRGVCLARSFTARSRGPTLGAAAAGSSQLGAPAPSCRWRRCISIRIRSIAAGGEADMPQTQQRRRRGQHPVLEAVNGATKWAVSMLAFGTLLWRRDLVAAWCVLGSVVAVVNCKLLKHFINEARPSDRKADPGMPSAHGNSLGFLATFVSLAASVSLGTRTPQGLALVLGVPTLGIYLAWLRVALGYHTVAQVVTQLYGATSAAIAFFIFQNVRRWVREAQLERRQEMEASGGSSDWS